MQALISNNRVVAVNVRDDGGIRDDHCIYAWATLADLVDCPTNTEVGMLFRDGAFSHAATVPSVVSRAQFILALLQIDLLDEVESAIAAADRATQINYKERLEFERSFPLIATMAAVLGKTDAEVDALFVLAATL